MSDGVLSQEEINALLVVGYRMLTRLTRQQVKNSHRMKLIPLVRLPISAWERQRQHCCP